MKIAVAGLSGKMGAYLTEAAPSHGVEIVFGVDKNPNGGRAPVYSSFGESGQTADAVIDFSSPSALRGEMEWAVNKKIPVVLAVTGYSAADEELIRECAEKIPVLRSSNFSAGIALLKKLARETAVAMEGCDAEIIEEHHRLKADSPSGTALSLAESVNGALGGNKKIEAGRKGYGGRGEEICIHSLRCGNITGRHTLVFALGDEIITLSHTALSKRVFADGAIKAAKWLRGKPAGLYGTDDIK